MHNLFELLLFSSSVASSSAVLTAALDVHGFTPNNRSSLFGQQRQAAGLLGGLLDNTPLGGAANALGAAADGLLQNGLLSDLQFFTDALGGVKAPSITMSNDKTRPYAVQGDTFPDYPSAAGRACTTQFTGCCDKANQNSGSGSGSNGGGSGSASSSSLSTSSSSPSGGPGDGKGKGKANGKNMPKGKGQGRRRAITNSTIPAIPKNPANPANQNGLDNSLSNKASNGVTVDACMTQLNNCNTVQRNAPFQTFNLDNVGPDPNMPDFDLLCSAPDAT